MSKEVIGEMTSAAKELLIHSTRLDPEPHQQHRLRYFINLTEDRDHLIHLSIREGLHGLFYRNLQRSGALESLNDRQRETLLSLYYGTVRCNLKRMHDLTEIHHSLNQKGIEVVLLQGMALLQQVYKDIGVRPMVDIDLWVLKDHYPDFRDILTGLGYMSDPLYPNTFRRGTTTLDVHTHLFWADRIQARKSLLAKDQDVIYRDTLTIDFEGEKARILSPYDQVLYSAVHALKHNVSQLLWLADIQNLVINWDTSDWEAAIYRAKELGLDRAFFYVSYLLHQHLDCPLPMEMRNLTGNRKLNILKKAALRGRIKKGHLPIWAPLVLFAPKNGWRKQFSYVLETAFPRPEVLMQVFPNFPHAKVWQLYLMRFVQLLGRIFLLPLRRI